MRIEAFSEGKYRQDADANEDRFLILPGRGYAVIDGVTDINGHLYDGMRAGKLASTIVQQVVARFLADPAEAATDPMRLIETVSSALRDAYARHGILDAARAVTTHRFGATLTLAVDLGASFRFILIGDSGLRLNGTETTIVDSGLDLITAALRQEAYRMVEKAGGDIEARRRVGRACAFYGVASLHAEMRPWLNDAALVALRAASRDRCHARLASVDVADIERLLDTGISGQGKFQNNATSALSYAVLDGFGVPMELVQVFDRPRATITSVELFTDGYFKPGGTADLSAWEAAFAEVERMDPEKVSRYPSVKGSTPDSRADDRTVVILHL
jgi:hypothetical protein